MQSGRQHAAGATYRTLVFRFSVGNLQKDEQLLEIFFFRVCNDIHSNLVVVLWDLIASCNLHTMYMYHVWAFL